ncbi:MAG: hypothetical protein AB7F86_01030 [Bdellovibrionales bacterium]
MMSKRTFLILTSLKFLLGFALPASGETVVYSNSGFLARCELKVDLVDETAIFSPLTHTDSVFAGFIPNEPGEVEIFKGQLLPTHTFRSQGENQVEETLTITFGTVGAKIEPIAYQLVNKRQVGNTPVASKKTCSGLVRKSN